ncbi:cell wall-binding repeat-containing protein [Cellulosimicrobium funkei]|uniref:cell wall-binding repeat-containing protein n=1 Tax=Cellulosimicrobium funkei TaxID=264251 RepID=UPI0036A67947
MSTGAHEHTDRTSAQSSPNRTSRQRRLTALAVAAVVAIGLVPGPATTAAAVSATDVVPVPTLSGGRLQAWGDPERRTSGELDVPPLPEGLDFVDAAVGHGFGLALRSDGQAVAWGAYDGERVEVPSLPDGHRFAAVGAGEHGLAYFLTTAGDVLVTGEASDGEAAVPALPEGVWYADVAATYRSMAALRSDGTIVAWGADPSAVPALPDGVRYVALAGGEFHFVALRSDGRVVSWGERYCGEGDVPAPSSSPYVALAAGLDVSFALRADGTIVARGCGSSAAAPVLPPGERAAAVTATGSHGFVVTTTGELRTWGLPLFRYTVPERPLPGAYVYEVAAQNWGLGAVESLVLTLTSDQPRSTPSPSPTDVLRPDAEGVVVWGARPDGELPPALPAGQRYVDVAVGGRHVALVRSDGLLLGYGDDATRVGEATRYQGPTQDVAAGEDHTAWVRRRGEHFDTLLFGPRDLGRQPFHGLSYQAVVTDVSAGGGFTVARTERLDGTGDVVVDAPAGGAIATPPAIPAGASVLAVAAGAGHALLVTSDGTVQAWGDPADGATDVPRPPDGTRFADVAAGSGFSLGLLDDGTIVGWGRNTYGQLDAPAPPPGEVFVDLDAGRDHAVALASDGSVHAWGREDAGQTRVPAAPEGATFAGVSAGGDTSAAIVAAPTTTTLTAPESWPGAEALPVRVDVSAADGRAEGEVVLLVDGERAAVLPLRDGTVTTRLWSVTADPARTVSAVFRGATGVAPSSSTASVRTGPAGSAPSPGSPSTVEVVRMAGANRYTTAVAATSSLAPGIPVLYLASGTGFADALSAAPAAAAEGGALLLVPNATIPPAVRAEIVRLQPERIVVVGGAGAVSAEVQSELWALRPEAGLPQILTLAGADRYETSRKVAESAFGHSVGAVVVADGRSFPDALAAGAAAGAAGVPVVLVPGNAASLAPEAARTFRSLGVRGVTVVGGSGAVSTGLERSAGRVPGVVGTERLGGTDRYGTAVALNDAYFGAWQDEGLWSPPAVNLATGADFPDALAGAAVAGLRREPLYVVPARCVPGRTLDAMNESAAGRVHLLGGPGALSDAVARLERC